MANIYNNLNLIDLNDFPVTWWTGLLDKAHAIMADPAAYAESCKGKIMGTHQNTDVFSDRYAAARRHYNRV